MPAGRRPVIGVLLDHLSFIGGGYEPHLRNALHQKGREFELDLLLIYGRGLGDPHPFCAVHNAIFDLPRAECVDGLVVASSCLAAHVGAEALGAFLLRYGTLPVSSLGVKIPGIPSVVIDNRAGVRAVVEHLIVEHACTRLAFVGGSPNSPEAGLRLAAYRETLAQHGLPADPTLVECGHFTRAGARRATAQILARNPHFDALVCANDAMAVGALEVLKAHGYRVPRDVRVTGFDDLSLARLGNPSITSVAQPFEKMAELALRAVLDRIAGRSTPSEVELTTELIARQSCGCLGRRDPERSKSVRRTRAAVPGSAVAGASLQSELAAVMKVGVRDRSSQAKRLLGALDREHGGPLEAFVDTVEQLLDEEPLDAELCFALRGAIDWLRIEFDGSSEPRLHEIWAESLSLIAGASATVQVQQQLLTDDWQLRLNGTAETLSVALDFDSLRNAIVHSLPTFGIQTAFISRSAGDAERQLEAFVSLRDGRALEPAQARFPGWCLLPPGASDGAPRDTFVIFPLTFEGEQLGLAAFQYSPDLRGYQPLREQIAAALRTVGLHRELVEQTMLHERSLLERASAAKRMDSLSVLASGVAHDLNNALGPLVALPGEMLAELAQLALPEATALEFRRDLSTLRSAAQRAAHTVKDLLTLGRQGKTRRTPLDLSQVVGRMLAGDASFLTRDGRSTLVRHESSPKPLMIRGSEPHLERAFTNLLRNALESLPAAGEIVIKTFSSDLQACAARYETIAPGHYAVVTIADNGLGIDPQDLQRVFEPYYTKKTLTEGSGSGLGLAIVHGVVKEHEGYIDVTSSLGVGTTFSLYFPICTAQLLPLPVNPGRLKPGVRVLLVDDDAVQLRTSQRVLARAGFQVDTASSPEAAYLLLGSRAGSPEWPYEALIADLRLGREEDGLSLCERARSLFPLLPTLLTSGQALDQRVEMAIASGIAWLAKPFTADELTSTLDHLLLAQPSVREAPLTDHQSLTRGSR